MKSKIIAYTIVFSIFMIESPLYCQNIVSTFEWDGVFFQIGTNKFIESTSAVSKRAFLKWGEKWPSQYPSIQYSDDASPIVSLDYFEKIILKGIEYSADNYVIAISPIQYIGAGQLWNSSRQIYQYGGKYTPMFICGDRYWGQNSGDSITRKKTIPTKVRRNTEKNFTEIIVDGKLPAGGYVLWLWSRSGNMNDKLHYFNYDPSISQITNKGVYSKTTSGRFHSLPAIPINDYTFISKADSSATANSFIIFEDKVPAGIPSIVKSNFNMFINDNAVNTNKNNFYLFKLHQLYFGKYLKCFIKKNDGAILSEYNSKNNFRFYSPVEEDLTSNKINIQSTKSPNSPFINLKLDGSSLSDGLYSIVITDKKDEVLFVYLFNFIND